MAGLGDILGGGGVAEQLVVWGVLNQALSAALAPYMSQLQQDVSARTPVEPLSPGDLADAVVRNYLTIAEATLEAAKSGVTAKDFAVMVPLHGDAPGPQQLATGLLRGLITKSGQGADAATFEQGIREGRLNDKWAPLIEGLSQVVLSPPDAAAAVVRNFMSPAEGEAAAGKSGVSAAVFETLVHLSGDAPGPQQLAEALRRGAIEATGSGPGSTSFAQGIAEGRLSDKWAPVIKDLAKLWPTPVDALAAALKGQVSPDEGKRLYELLGGDLQFYDWLLHSEGDGPTPLQAADWARRGIIPWDGIGPDNVSYAQAVRESRYRDKWSDAYKKSAEYQPPESVVMTLLKDGAATKEQATGWLAKVGVTPDVIAAMIAEADATDLSDYRGLTVQAVLGMYYQRLITSDDATSILESLHVSKTAVPLMLTYADLQRAISQQSHAITRIGTLYAARKITEQTAKNSLVTLQVPPAAINDIMATWQLENSISVKLLTEAQIVDAWHLQIMDDTTALTELNNIGYTPYDAWVLLSIKAKQPLPGQPAPGPGAAQGTVIPGST